MSGERARARARPVPGRLLPGERTLSRLAARIWLPADAMEQPVPAILEYIPYRKNDGTVTRDALMHPYFAGHGYAAIRVDMRGSGDSDGIMYDEYLLDSAKRRVRIHVVHSRLDEPSPVMWLDSV